MHKPFAELPRPMCKSILLTLLLASTAFGQWSWVVEPSITELPKEPSVKKTFTPQEATVQVKSPKTGPYTGTAICSHTVVTCAHGLTNENDIVTVDGKPAKVEKIIHGLDVALLRTEHELKPAAIAEKWPKVGEAVTGYGYEMNLNGKLGVFKSNVTRLNVFREGDTILIRKRAIPGRSGGGLFNAAGQLIGVNRGAMVATDESIYSGLDSIKAIINGDLPKIAQKAIEPKQSTPPAEFLKQPDCPSGQCPLIKRLPAPKAVGPAYKTGQLNQCPNGQCVQAPAAKAKGEVRDAPTPVSPLRKGFIFRGRR